MIMWSAVILRIFENGSTRSPGQGSTTGCWTGPVGAGAGSRGPGAVGAGAPRSMKPRMSCFVTRPAKPVPGIVEMSTWCSAAILRTRGVDFLRRRSSAVSAPSPPCLDGAVAGGRGRSPTDAAAAAGGGGGGGAGLGGSGLDAGGAEAAAGGDATAPFSVSITATSVCTGTVWPSCTLISASTPAAGAGISASTLSVEISNKGSSRFTVSPTFLSHLLKVPSAIDSPICGIKTSTRAIVAPSVRREPARGLHNVVRLRQHEVFQRRRVRQRHIMRGHAHDRPVEPLERLLIDPRGDLAGNAARARVFVHDQHLVRPFHRGDDRGVVHRQQCAQIEHFDRNTVFLIEPFRRFERFPQRRAVTDDGKMLPFARQASLPDG